MAMNSRQKQSRMNRLILMYGLRCCWCGQVFPKEMLTLEHIKPKSLGGSDKIENLALACACCNQKRGNSLLPPASWPPKKTAHVSWWLVAMIFFYRLGNHQTIFETLTGWNCKNY